MFTDNGFYLDRIVCGLDGIPKSNWKKRAEIGIFRGCKCMKFEL